MTELPATLEGPPPGALTTPLWWEDRALLRPEEAARRDRVMRAYFLGKDWDRNEEFQLKRRLVCESHRLLPAFPFLVDDEWEVVSGMTNLGRGDLLFTDGACRFAVVEVKFIDVGRTGHTARVKRTRSRGLVIEQARTYARAMVERLGQPGLVRAFTWTNEDPDGPVEIQL